MIVILLAAAACTSTAPRPGTGDLTFRLTWTGPVDLDLYAQSPLNERVNFLLRRAESGGELDIDCNAGEVHCESPMENIYWPRGSAPSGRYKYWVLVANEEGLSADQTFLLQVLRRGEVVIEHTGVVEDLVGDRVSGIVEIDG